jgi:hypothetical protein
MSFLRRQESSPEKPLWGDTRIILINIKLSAFFVKPVYGAGFPPQRE